MYKLAICIPTYNRSRKVTELVRELLRTNFNWLQVVVSDNCSTDDTVAELEKIDDPRLHIYKSEKNVGAIENYLRAIENGDAVYSMFLTDKDHLDIGELKSVAERLENYKPVAGYIEHGPRARTKIRVAPRFLKLFTVGYQCIHPSGYFFSSANLKNQLKNKDLRRALVSIPFPFEILLAACSDDGDLAVIRSSLIIQETPAEYRAVKSHTYSALQKNLYFTPDNRILVFSIFLNDIDNNASNVFDKKFTKIRMLYWFLSVSTLGYAKIVSDPNFCEHYGLRNSEINKMHILNVMQKYYNFIIFLKNDKFALVFAFLFFCTAVIFKYFIWLFGKKFRNEYL
jgi:glycosyltransferase involved in cell wall biosynthesis